VRCYELGPLNICAQAPEPEESKKIEEIFAEQELKTFIFIIIFEIDASVG